MGSDSVFRRSLLRHGLALRFNTSPSFSMNLLDAPVSANSQAYAGERPFGKEMINPILTWDMKALHLNGAQLNISAGLQWVTWNKAGPSGVTLSSLYIYKSLAEDRFEVKAGYTYSNFEFVGMQVGGSTATTALGVYAVLPNEVGLSYLPLSTPSLNMKWNAPSHLYTKIGLQRSTDAAGGPATIARNATAMRFMPKGDKLLTIFEGGYNRAATDVALSTWVRGGYMRNTTRYANSLTGGTSSGNFCAYLLADRQLSRSFGMQADKGLYVGGSAMIAPARMNAYSQYYELRVYEKGPFHGRPSDMFSLVATRSVHSPDLMRNLVAQGATVWRHTNSITGSYAVRAARGTYFNAGLGYIQGPAVSPRVPNALVVTVAANTFF